MNYTGGKIFDGVEKIGIDFTYLFLFLKPIDETLISVKLIEKRYYSQISIFSSKI